MAAAPAPRRGCIVGRMRGLAIGMLMLAGCTSSGGGAASTPALPATPSSGVGSVPVVAATPTPRGPLKVEDVVCERAVRCGLIGRAQLDECREGPGRSRLTLVWGYDERFERERQVAKGRIKLESADAQACLAFLVDAPCKVWPATFPAGCDDSGPEPVQIAAVPPGGACSRWEECIDGFCTAQTACEGFCKARSPVDGPCDEDQICREDAFCWEGRCRPRADVGAECRGHWQWCKDGLICDGYRKGNDDDHYHMPEQPGRCSAGKLVGEDCVPPRTAGREVCVLPLYCDWGADQPVCREHLAAGAECRWVDACAEGLACVGLVLGGVHPTGTRLGVRQSGRCAPMLDVGETCDPLAFISGCPEAAACDPQQRVCRSTGHAGDPCVSSWVLKPPPDDAPTRSQACFSSHYCHVRTRQCTPQLAMGARCEPVAFGVEDSPCFLGECDAKTRRCAAVCAK